MVSVVASVTMLVMACARRLLGCFTDSSAKECLRELMFGSDDGSNDGGLACSSEFGTLEAVPEEEAFPLAWDSEEGGVCANGLEEMAVAPIFAFEFLVLAG